MMAPIIALPAATGLALSEKTQLTTKELRTKTKPDQRLRQRQDGVVVIVVVPATGARFIVVMIVVVFVRLKRE